jgi:putative transposase
MRKIKFGIDEYYHIYNRGVDKRIIFLDERDYERFLCLLYLSNSTKNFEISKDPNSDWSFKKLLDIDRGEQLISIGAWCLMPNHFHILIKEKMEGGISKFMLKLSVGYSNYFNKKYFRRGSLFEGTFKARHADSDRYLKYLYSYIHLNPIGIMDKGWKKKQIGNTSEAKKFVREFNYSSYKDYLEEDRLENKIINKEVFPKYFENIKKFEQMMDFWMEGDEFSEIKPQRN